MKQLSIIIAILMLASCSKQSAPSGAHSSQITLVSDITDTLECIPLPDPLLSIYDFPNDKNQSAGFRHVLITDKKLNPVEEIHLADGEKSEADNVNEEVDYRERLVYSFYDALRKSVRDFPKQYAVTGPLEHSECFATIATELRELAVNNAAKKTLIVYSDLMENTNGFSCYSRGDIHLLQVNPNKVAGILQKQCPLPDQLKGITVFFVFHPRTREQDVIFREMVSIYKELLHERGARVVIQATNKYYTQ